MASDWRRCGRLAVIAAQHPVARVASSWVRVTCDHRITTCASRASPSRTFSLPSGGRAVSGGRCCRPRRPYRSVVAGLARCGCCTLVLHLSLFVLKPGRGRWAHQPTGTPAIPHTTAQTVSVVSACHADRAGYARRAESCNAPLCWAVRHLRRAKRRYRNPRKSSCANLRGMAVDAASGLFALGGVALAGVWAEIRAGREARARQSSELVSLKREICTEATLRIEAVASSVAQWTSSATEGDVSRQAVWAALTSAYEISARIRIVADTQVPANAMEQVLTVYRKALESNDRRLPKPNDVRAAMIREFRKDLGKPDR